MQSHPLSLCRLQEREEIAIARQAPIVQESVLGRQTVFQLQFRRYRARKQTRRSVKKKKRASVAFLLIFQKVRVAFRRAIGSLSLVTQPILHPLSPLPPSGGHQRINQLP